MTSNCTCSVSELYASYFLYVPLQHERDYAARKIDFLQRLEEDLTIADIEKPLTRENYKEKFHKLLCWEEKTHIEILEERLILMNYIGSYSWSKIFLFLFLIGAMGITKLQCMKLDLNRTGLRMQDGIATKCLDAF